MSTHRRRRLAPYLIPFLTFAFPLVYASDVPAPSLSAAIKPATQVLPAAFDLGGQPPHAERRPNDVSVHGDKRVDDYFWLRERDDPAVLSYLEAENAYTAQAMAPTEPLQKQLYEEILARVQETDSTPPARFGEWRYYSRTEAGKQYRIYCRRSLADDSPEHVLLDANQMAEGHAFFEVEDFVVSDDGNLLAYSVDLTGYRQYELHVRDLRTGAELPLTLPRVTSVEWAEDNRTLVYTQEDPVAKRSYRLARHDIATDADETLWEEHDDQYDIDVHRSRDGAWLFCTSASSETTEVRVCPANSAGAIPGAKDTSDQAPAAPPTAWRVVLPREEDHEYYVDHADGRFWIITNKDAKDFRLVTAPVATPDPSHWTEVLPHRPGTTIEGLDLFAKYAVVEERSGGLPHLRVIEIATGAQRTIVFPDATYELDADENHEFAATAFRYRYQSMVTPPSVFDYDFATGRSTLVKEQPVPGGFDRTRYHAERIWATAEDGTRIPVSLVYRTELRRAGPQPLLLYGYGSYGLSMPDSFSAARVSLLDRGVIYAIAHIRGGGEMGETWHDEGKMAEKQNTFSDFAACARHLVDAHYTTSSQLVIQGGSAGGLLMGAVLNQHPELYHAAVVDVPFVDVLNTMLDASLPLTTGEYLEWGDPNDAEEYAWMRAYSPYDNIRAQHYPAMLVTTSLHDSQVPYWEAAKYVARLRATKLGDEPLLLRTNLAAGHGGASGRYDALHETAFEYAFLLTALGL